MKVFITGASSGIGQALAIEYAKRFHKSLKIGLVARREAALKALQSQLQSYQVESTIYVADVRDAQAIKVAADGFVDAYGAPNIVIASAGVSSGTLTQQAADIAQFKAVIDINVLGLVHTFQPFIDSMQIAAENGNSAQLVGIASVAGIRGLPGAGAYSASKAAAIAYLESLRVEMAALNIQVSTIAPGYIRTPMTDINDYPMPFLMDVDLAAKKFVHAITAKKRFVIVPWQMGLITKLMRLLPCSVWDCLAKQAPHKKRIDQL